MSDVNLTDKKVDVIDPQDPARYTPQQEREMGVVDEQGRKIQPAASFVMIALTFVLVAGIAAVMVAVLMRLTGAGTGS